MLLLVVVAVAVAVVVVLLTVGVAAAAAAVGWVGCCCARPSSNIPSAQGKIPRLGPGPTTEWTVWWDQKNVVVDSFQATLSFLGWLLPLLLDVLGPDRA
jgi:hypothetical protein